MFVLRKYEDNFKANQGMFVKNEAIYERGRQKIIWYTIKQTIERNIVLDYK